MAGGFVSCSVRDTFPTTESQETSVTCSFAALGSYTHSSSETNSHQGNVLKGGAYYDSRLLQMSDLPMTRGKYEISPCPRGSLQNMVVQFASQEMKQKKGYLSILVHSVGINFRDVLNVLGAYPGDPGPPGSDCSGIVYSSCSLSYPGANFMIGDAVLALASGSFGTTVDVPFSVTSLMCDGVPFELAASTPSVYMTVWLALKQASGARACDTILVHAGSGGIGTAATNVGNSLGATVWSTAGNTTHLKFKTLCQNIQDRTK